ncbi:transmembrane transport protein [Kitasatospora sp. NPDC094019]|uniref:transmembrane transport protein n=1 Tax=Kitasatospora sp. NPDC094019 TaxID=3364091 RepID=UPI0038222933
MSERNAGNGRAGVPGELDRVLAAEVSLGARLGRLAVGLAGGSAVALITVLWATEPEPLPLRTRIAFAALIAVGAAWAAFAAWALTRRRPLYARDRVLAATIALVATVTTSGAGTALAATRGTPTGALITGLAGAALVGAAGFLLRRARARHRALLRLRDTLRQDGP